MDNILISAPKALVFFAALLLAIIVTSMSAGEVLAHGGHQSSVSSGATANGELSAVDVGAASHRSSPVEVAMVMDADGSHKSSTESGVSDCCCGVVTCHSGMSLAGYSIEAPATFGVRVVARSSSGRPQRDESGLERPPRSAH